MVGTAYPLRGGLAAYNERLTREFIQEGDDAKIYTFSLQYPSFLFPGKTQYSTSPPPPDLDIRVCINSINPLNWIRVGLALRRERPDLIVVKFWLPFMGACFGTILRIAKRRGTTVVCIADNIIPHEKRLGDRQLTKYFIGVCDAFITMSDKVYNDLRTFDAAIPATKVEHPLYDHFGDPIPMREARERLGLPLDRKVVLFFGFIRKYKGLDLLLEAVRSVKDAPLFVIAGEYYEDGVAYESLIDQLGIRDQLVLKTDFIPDEEVKYYLCAADVLVQPYRAATQSGVTPLAYHFECPMVVTNVGGLPDLVPDGKVGIVCEPSPAAIADGIDRFYAMGRQHFVPFIKEEKKRYSWKTLVEAIKSYLAV